MYRLLVCANPEQRCVEVDGIYLLNMCSLYTYICVLYIECEVDGYWPVALYRECVPKYISLYTYICVLYIPIYVFCI